MNVERAKRKIQSYYDSHAVGAASGANEALDAILDGETAKVIRLYDEACSHHDLERKMGIAEIADIMGVDLNQKLESIYTHRNVNTESGKEYTLSSYEKETERYMDFKRGWYEITVKAKDEENDPLKFELSIENEWGEPVRLQGGWERNYSTEETGEYHFEIEEINQGICKVKLVVLDELNGDWEFSMTKKW